MPRVTFLREFDFNVPGKPVTISYKRGWSGMVTRECAAKAILQGKARITTKPEPVNDSRG